MRHLPAVAAVVLLAGPAAAYVEAPLSLGQVVAQSTHVCTMVVEKVDRQNNLIIYRKVADHKGKHPQDVVKHNIGRGGLRPGEWQEIMAWAEPGKTAVFCHNGGASETFIGVTWYQAYPQGEWWGMSHAEPFLLRSYSGKPDKLGPIVADIVAGKEVIVPCMMDGDKEALHKKTAKVQRLKASLQLDYNPKRDFVGWGGEDIRRLAGMPGFDRLAALGSPGADAQAVSVCDFDGDGKPDLLLAGPNRVLLLQNNGDGYSEVALPNLAGVGARAAVWADYTGDGTPDLFLATPAGPRLYANLGGSRFRDDTKRLPAEPGYNLTAAAWADFTADGKPDLLLANGFHGLRLYQNVRPDDPAKLAPPALGPWHAVGPFRKDDGSKNFETAFAPEEEKETDLARKHKGKRDMEVVWQKKEYADGNPVDLGEFGNSFAVYLHREITAAGPTALPVSLGSDDTLTVWLNGDKVHSENVNRGVAPDQARVVLNLKPGKNRLLMKVCNIGTGASGFYFRADDPATAEPLFQDVSAEWGLGPAGLAADLKGDALSVADFDGDGRPDFLFAAGTGLVVRNAGAKFEIKADAGVSFRPGKVGPAVGDFDGDGFPDLFVPQPGGGSKLFRNDGTGTFADVTAKAGDLAKLTAHAVGAAWGDFDNDGRPDLLVCTLRGPNRLYRNAGDGTFADKTAAVGLSQRVFNTQAAGWADLNADGRLDLILANEGQDAVALYGAASVADPAATPVVVRVPAGLVGGTVTVTAGDGKRVASAAVAGGDGRGGQPGPPRFALPPGKYTVTVRGGDGKERAKQVEVASSPMVAAVE